MLRRRRLCPPQVALLVVPVVAASECVRWTAGSSSLFPSEDEALPGSVVFESDVAGSCSSEKKKNRSLAAEAHCDVWWRPVTDDVIPPMPELAVRLPEYDVGACRRGGQVGVVGFRGDDFGVCRVPDGRAFDGGGFDILQARQRLRTSGGGGENEERSCVSKGGFDRRRRRLSALVDGVSAEDRGAFERSTNRSFESLATALRDDADDCYVEAFLSPSRFVPHDTLNADGAHALRTVVARRAYERRVTAYHDAQEEAPQDEEHGGENRTRTRTLLLSSWLREGILVLDYAGDAELFGLLRLVAGEDDIPAPPYEWVAREVASTEGDPQFAAHVDSFATVVKVWRFLAPLDQRHGPFTFVRGSQAITDDKLRWVFDYSTKDQALREPSFRLEGNADVARSSPFVARCKDTAEAILPLSNGDTLVVADTSAVHFRAPAQPGFLRRSLRIKGDNGGGLPRKDPFRRGFGEGGAPLEE